MNTELTPTDYKMLAMMLDNLIDVVGENENHILVSLMDLIDELIETYENKYVPELAKITLANICLIMDPQKFSVRAR